MNGCVIAKNKYHLLLLMVLHSYFTVSGSSSSSNIIFPCRFLDLYTQFFESCKHINDSFSDFGVTATLQISYPRKHSKQTEFCHGTETHGAQKKDWNFTCTWLLLFAQADCLIKMTADLNTTQFDKPPHFSKKQIKLEHTFHLHFLITIFVKLLSTFVFCAATQQFVTCLAQPQVLRWAFLKLPGWDMCFSCTCYLTKLMETWLLRRQRILQLKKSSRFCWEKAELLTTGARKTYLSVISSIFKDMLEVRPLPNI